MRPLVTLFGAYNAQLGGKMKLYKVIHRALISTAVFGALTIPAKADVDMSGKTIEWTIPFSETGGSLALRAAQQSLKYLPFSVLLPESLSI